MTSSRKKIPWLKFLQNLCIFKSDLVPSGRELDAILSLMWLKRPSLFFSPLVVLALALALLAMAELSTLHFLLPMENRVSDYFVRTQTLKLSADPDIVIVEIDEKSLAEMAGEAGRWPWPRSVHGELIAALQKQQPRAIVFDIQFADPDIYRPESDALFNESVRLHRNIYFPMVRLDPADDSSGALIRDLAAPLGIVATSEAQADARIRLSVSRAVAPASWETGAVDFQEDKRQGTINFVEDKSDGIGRRYFVYLSAYGWRIPSLPAKVASDLGYAVPPGEDFILGWRGGTQSHTHVSYSELYLDASRKSPQRPQNEFRNKIIIIGATAPGLHDIRSTPVSSRHQGVEVLATALDNLKGGGYFRGAPAAFAYGLSLSLLMTLCWTFFRHNRRTLAIGVLMMGASIALFAASYLAVSEQWLLPVLTPLVFAWTYYFAAALREYLKESTAREQTVRMFNRFLDPRIVAGLVEQGKGAQDLSSQNQTLTVLFSDIRNFTTYSEQHSAAQVVDLLNRYFSMQVEVIFRHGGTLDKFIGDAIMAFWGAPTADPAHASHAVSAALEMLVKLEEFKLELGAEGASFDVGIGIHSGPAVIGFIGSEQRQDYTAIGDTVNLASRIEGLTKGVARILVSAETVVLCKDGFDFIDRGFHQVKGRAQEVHLFEPKEMKN
jgi:adenylate cyclase